MKNVSCELRQKIVDMYLLGYRYWIIEEDLEVSRWNIQDALSKQGVKTNRIKSPPRLPGNKKKEPGRLMERYHDGDLLPPMGVNKNNPVLDSDLDIMERMDNCEDANDFVAEKGSCEIVIDENNKVRYEENV